MKYVKEEFEDCLLHLSSLYISWLRATNKVSHSRAIAIEKANTLEELDLGLSKLYFKSRVAWDVEKVKNCLRNNLKIEMESTERLKVDDRFLEALLLALKNILPTDPLISLLVDSKLTYKEASALTKIVENT